MNGEFKSTQPPAKDRSPTMTTTARAEVLHKATWLVCADREKEYGGPKENFARIAALWSAYVGEVTFSPADVAVMLGHVKDARIRAQPTHVDSWVDKAGYAACGAEAIGVEL